jgi:hypothetical protein
MKYLVDGNCRLFTVSALAGLALGLGACSQGEEPEPVEESAVQGRAAELTNRNAQTVCGWETLPSPARPAQDPCAAGEALLSADFGTASSANSQSFELAADSHVCVVLDSSDDNGHSVSIDGEAVARDLRRPEGGRYTVRLPAGRHSLEVNAPAGEARGVTLSAVDLRPGQDVVYGDSGVLELTGVMVDHPMFSPNGDHYHDTALFNADNFPRSLPGKDSGQFDYFLDWRWEIVEAESCDSLDIALTGRSEVDSPTNNVQALWDGSDDGATAQVQPHGSSTSIAAGAAVPDGKYLYRYHASLTRSDGLVIDTVTSRAHSMLVDSTSSRWPSSLGTASTSSVGSLTNSGFIRRCDPQNDPDNCQCPSASSLPQGTRCTFASISSLEDFDDATTVPTSSFMETSYDSSADRWTVAVDLREFNGGGLVPQSNGTWQNIAELQSFVEDLTGVPADSSQDRLFNFDYVQLGYSTPVTPEGATTGFNHFLLDVITDANGDLTIGTTSYDLAQIFANGGNSIPSKYQIANERDGDECYHNGNSDGEVEVEARSCTELRMANLDPGNTDLGIYRIKTRMFEFLIDGEGTARETSCTSNGCSVRTIQRDAMMIGAERGVFTEEQAVVEIYDEYDAQYGGVPSVIIETDRAFVEGNDSRVFDGVCSRGVLSTYDSMEIPLDSGDGALPKVCIINGIW